MGSFDEAVVNFDLAVNLRDQVRFTLLKSFLLLLADLLELVSVNTAVEPLHLTVLVDD